MLHNFVLLRAFYGQQYVMNSLNLTPIQHTHKLLSAAHCLKHSTAAVRACLKRWSNYCIPLGSLVCVFMFVLDQMKELHFKSLVFFSLQCACVLCSHCADLFVHAFFISPLWWKCRLISDVMLSSTTKCLLNARSNKHTVMVRWKPCFLKMTAFFCHVLKCFNRQRLVAYWLSRT